MSEDRIRSMASDTLSRAIKAGYGPSSGKLRAFFSGAWQVIVAEHPTANTEALRLAFFAPTSGGKR